MAAQILLELWDQSQVWAGLIMPAPAPNREKQLHTKSTQEFVDRSVYIFLAMWDRQINTHELREKFDTSQEENAQV